MKLAPVWDWLEAEIFTLPSVDGARPLFNFYRDAIAEIENPDGARIRRDNLRRRLEMFTTAPEYLVIGEAPGWRGGRFSGVPLISEAMLVDGSLGFSGSPTFSSQQPLREATATIFWQTLRPLRERVFTWNCLPLHPHRPAEPLSNRAPSPQEARDCLRLLSDLTALLNPRQVIAVGRCAEAAVQTAGIPAIAIRHPSHGGAKAFQTGIRAIIPGTLLAPENRI